MYVSWSRLRSCLSVLSESVSSACPRQGCCAGACACARLGCSLDLEARCAHAAHPPDAALLLPDQAGRPGAPEEGEAAKGEEGVERGGPAGRLGHRSEEVLRPAGALVPILQLPSLHHIGVAPGVPLLFDNVIGPRGGVVESAPPLYLLTDGTSARCSVFTCVMVAGNPGRHPAPCGRAEVEGARAAEAAEQVVREQQRE